VAVRFYSPPPVARRLWQIRHLAAALAVACREAECENFHHNQGGMY
jgi:hypothetical protein